MKLNLGKHEVDLSDEHLKFNETNLNEKLMQEASLYNYYGEQLAKASAMLTILEDEYELLLAKKFSEYKGSGSDKLAESKANSDQEVIDALKKVREAKLKKDLIATYLRSMDKGHENMINTAISIRNELKKLNPVFKKPDECNYSDDMVNDIVRGRR